MAKTNILLESGTNEFELIEFKIGNENFGINVAKVLEIMKYPSEITLMPNSNPCVEGIFKPRDKIITIINLAKYMNLQNSENSERDILIITNFNKVKSAFHVHNVETIHRISWTDISKPDESIYSGIEGLATGIANLNGRLITIIDFEKILGDINPSSTIQTDDMPEKLKNCNLDEQLILIAEDSKFLMSLISQTLNSYGYTNLIFCDNGQEAWEKLKYLKKNDEEEFKKIKCVVTDIEMPQLGGHRLLKLIRDDADLKNLPVIIFSSLITSEMKRKGDELGATDQISKPEIKKLISLLNKHVL